jgi:hypothetical protein
MKSGERLGPYEMRSGKRSTNGLDRIVTSITPLKIG